MRYFLFVISCCLFLSCKEKQKETPKIDIRETEPYTATFQGEKTTVALSEKARTHALKWAAYITAKNEIDRLHKTSVNQVIANAETISEIMESLAVSVPDSLQTKSVIARLTVLTTKAHVLAQEAKKATPEAEQIKKVSLELPEEFDNLNIQINEIFLESIKDFEARLDQLQEDQLQEKANQDSLSTSE